MATDTVAHATKDFPFATKICVSRDFATVFLPSESKN